MICYPYWMIDKDMLSSNKGKAGGKMRKKIFTKIKCIAGLLVLGLVLTACGQKDSAAGAVSQTIEKYKNMTYGEYKESTGNDVEFYHGTRFIGEIPDSSISVIYDGEYDEEVAGAVLQDSALPLRFQGKLASLVNGIEASMTIEELVKVLSPKDGAPAVYEILEGAGTAYYVGNDYVQIQFDEDQDGVLDTAINISLDESGKESVDPENETWLYEIIE